MKLIISPADNTLFIDYRGRESGHKFYLLPTDDPVGDLSRIFGVPTVVAQKSLAPRVMVYQRRPNVRRPGISAVHILTPEEMEELPHDMRRAVDEYFRVAIERRHAEDVWERRRMQMITLFLKETQVYQMVASEKGINLDAAARMLAGAEIRTAIVQSRSPALNAIKLYTTVPSGEAGKKEGKQVTRPAYWHISALPFSRPPVRVPPLKWVLGYSVDGDRACVTMTASLQSLLGLWRQYRAAESLEQKARVISKALSAAAEVYQKDMAVPVSTEPYGLVVIKKMPEATYEQTSARRASINVMWTPEWKERYGD